MNRRLLALAVVGLAVLLIVPIVLLVVARPFAAPGESPVIPGQSPSPSPSAPADGAIAFVDAGSPEEAAWYRIGGNPRLFPPRLEIGTMAGGVTFEAEMTDPAAQPNAIVPLRPVLGVGDGVVVIVEDDGGHSTMRAVEAASGAVTDLLVSNQVIVNGLLDRDGRVAYYVTADRLTGDLTGAWRLAVGEGLGPEPIEELLAAAPEFRLAAITERFSRMLISPDGTTLGLFRCLQLDCALRAVRTDDGSLVGDVRIQRGGDAFGITSTSVLIRPIVPDGPFRFGELIELATGATAPMPFEGWPFGTPVLVEGADGPVMVVQSAGQRAPDEAGGMPAVPPKVAVIGAADMGLVAEYAPPLTSLAIIGADDSSVGADLPPGWILMRGGEPGEVTMSAYALNTADGTLVRLPAVEGFFIQG